MWHTGLISDANKAAEAHRVQLAQALSRTEEVSATPRTCASQGRAHDDDRARITRVCQEGSVKQLTPYPS